MSDCLLLEVHGPVAIVTLNRTESLNALNRAMLEALTAMLTDLSGTPELRVLILTGAGKAFAAGADIAEMAEMTQDEAEQYHRKGVAMLQALERLPIPVIAAVNGYALGGGNELAMAADLRIASEKASFGQPEAYVGISPGFTATQRLPRLVGKAKALELLMTGDRITAEEAHRIGLVNRVVPADRLMEEALQTAERILRNSPAALRRIKEAVRLSEALTPDVGQERAILLNRQCFETPEQREGMTAFLQRRPPVFPGSPPSRKDVK